MDSDEVWRTIDEQRSDVADLLDKLSEQEWSTPSLCAAWTVRQVAAHLTLAHMRLLPCLVAIGRSRGSIDRMIRDTAIRQARLPVQDYAPRLRAMIGSRRTVPFVTELEPLLDILVHAQDIARPLGRAWPMPVDAAMTAADRVWSMSAPFHARRRLAGYQLVATDTRWHVGSGQPVEGPMAALLLLLTGRPAALTQLSGTGAADLAATYPADATRITAGGATTSPEAPSDSQSSHRSATTSSRAAAPDRR
jgi:uncharacterized protein (TIGR03083 family)